jgi:uncharacterized membrane-anchored protein YhcB (DUF1043 family)
MIEYLRIPKNKFWGWVASSLAIGLVLGVGATYAIGRASTSGQIDDLKSQLASQTAEAASRTADLQSRLDSSAASLTALSQQYEQLKSESAAASQAAKDDESSSDSANTDKLEVLSRKVSPSTVATGDDITLTAKVQGAPDKVTMRVRNANSGFDETYTLKKASTSGSSQTWQRTVSAPKKTGKYTYYATAYRDDKSATMPNASPSSFVVE